MILKYHFLLLVAGNPSLRQTREYAVEKSPTGPRAYLGLELPNRLKVLLVSDPRAERAGASLAVSSGAMDDPNDIPGLAHLTEHSILQGSSKYPSPSVFTETIVLSGGKYGTNTTADATAYSFEVGHWALEKSLDMFAHLFISPLFDEATVTREVTRVDNEYKWEKTNPDKRFLRAELAALGTAHKYTAFHTGNIDTLLTGPRKRGLNIKEMVASHFQRHYSANIMHLVVYGKQDIATLKKLTTPFSDIPDRRLVPSDAGSPFNTGNLVREVAIDARKDFIKVQFILGPSNPALLFIHHLLAEAGIQSLQKSLIQKKISSTVVPGPLEKHKAFSSFAFQITLTPEGRTQKKVLLKIIFAYINAIQQGITQERYENFLSQQSLRPSSPSAFAKDLAEKLNEGASFDTVLGSGRHPFDARLLKATLLQFNTSSFIVYEGKELRGKVATEPWYGAKYTSAPFTKDQLKPLSSATAEMYRITMPEMRPISKEETTATVRLVDNSKTGYILAVNQKSGTPSVVIEFVVPPSEQLLNFARVLHGINKKNSFGKLIESQKRLSSTFKILERSLILETADLAGDIQAVATLLELSANTKGRFYPIKRELIKNTGRVLTKPGKRDELAEIISLGPSYAPLREFTLDDFKYCYEALKNSRINLIASGDISDKDLIKYREDLLTKLGTDRTEAAQPLTWKLTRKGNFVYVAPTSHSSIVYYLHLYDNAASHALAHATAALINIPLQNQLQDNEQLAYILHSGLLDQKPSGGLKVVMESSHHPIYLEARIEASLAAFYESIVATPEKELKKKLSSIIRALDLPLPDPQRSAKNSWWAVRNRYFASERATQLKQILQAVSKQQLLTFLKTHLLKSPTRRKISIHAEPKPGDRALPENYALADCGEQILDIAAWREEAQEEM